ncbi:HvfC/BufC family peptide modification chaperone [Flavobacterium sp. 3HN19-14]|uniref:HvfC/BufC family peptide modification chaperone n=1 Tax=Flavobacterium sp. 3HN19-14 TaxID=3448133 RepID=UPI003EE0B27A
MIDKDTLPIAEVHNWMQGMLIQHVPVSYSELTTDEMVNDSQRLSASQHLMIYRQSYIARLRACMQSQFKCLNYALGEALFTAFADEYLDNYPSSSYTLNDLGKNFSSFLEKTRPEAENGKKEDWPDFMIELAAFEYSLSEIFDMNENTSGKIPDKSTPDHLLVAAPSLHLYEQQFPICRYYLDFNAGLSPELPFPAQSFAAVSRQNFKLGLFNIGADQYHFLNYVKAGASVAAAKDILVGIFNVDKVKLEEIWPIWRGNFIDSGFLIVAEINQK